MGVLRFLAVLAFLSAGAVSGSSRDLVLSPVFEPNLGQAPGQARFLNRDRGREVWLEPHRLLIRSTIPGEASQSAPRFSFHDPRPSPVPWSMVSVAMRWLGGRLDSVPVSDGPPLSAAHYFLADSPSLPRTVPQYARVRYPRIYDKIDLVAYWTGSQLEYDFELAPYADPSRIELEFDGARASVNAAGDLLLESLAGTVLHKRPIARQGDRIIEAAFLPLGRNRVAFSLGSYDSSKPLTIDPVVYITYIGGSGINRVSGVALDRLGNSYFTGVTTSTDFRTQNPLQSSFAGGPADAWIVKLDPSGRRLYATYIGGSGQDDGVRIRADSQGNAYVSGITRSQDFPTTPNAPQRTLKGASDAFVLKLAPNGDRLLFSTLLGGTGDESAPALMVDPAGVVCVAGSTDSGDLPVTRDAVQSKNAGRFDAYIAILDPAANSLAYLTYFGGSGTDTLNGIALGQGGNLYFTGQTESANFPITGAADQKTLRGPSDAYLVRLTSDRRAIAYSTFIGGSQIDVASDVSVDLAENVMVSGNTRSSDFPVTSPPPSGALFPTQTVFVVEFLFPRGSQPPDRLLSAEDPVGSKALTNLLDGRRQPKRADLEFGIEVGSPIVKDKHWFWESWMRPDTVLGSPVNVKDLDGTNCVIVNSSTAPTDDKVLPRLSIGPGPAFGHVSWRLEAAFTYRGVGNGTATDFASGPTNNIYAANISSALAPPTFGLDPYRGLEGVFAASYANEPSGQLHVDNAPFSVNRPATHEPIFTDAGQYFEHELDFSLGGPLPLSFVRYYGSALNRNKYTATALGENWMHNFDWRLFFFNQGARVILRMFRGKLLEFNRSGNEWRMAVREPHNYQFSTDGANYRFFEPQGEHTYTFNSTGLLTRIEDLNGNALALTQGPNGLLEVSDTLGRSLKFVYTGNHLTQVSDQANRTVRFAQTGNDLASATDTAGKVTTYAYTAVGANGSLLTRRTLPEGNTPFAQEYDFLARANRQTDARGNVLKLEFNTPGPLLTRVTDPTGAANIQRTFFSIASLLDSTDSEGNTAYYSWDANARNTGLKDRLGAVTGFVYDAKGNLTQITNARGASAQFSYNEFRAGPFVYHRPDKATFPGGSTEQWRYDTRGNPTSFTDPAGQAWTVVYNDRGLPLTYRSPSGGVTTAVYNADATIATFTLPTGVILRYSYDNLKRVTRVTFSDNASRRFTYDAKDRPVTFTDERGKTTTYSYDSNGRQTSIVDALGNLARYGYDANDRLVSVTNPVGKIWRIAYDRVGRPESITDPTGLAHRVSRNTSGDIREIFDSAGKLLTIDRNAEGIPSALTLPTGETARLSTNLMRSVTQFTSPAGGATKLARDFLERITAIVNPFGDSLEILLDAAGRTSRVTLPDKAIVGHTYDAASLPTSITDPRGNMWKVNRDSAGRIAAAIDPLGETTTYAYNDRGLLGKIGYPGGTATSYSYDETDALTQAAYPDGTADRFTRDDLGQITKANGVDLAYDSARRIIESNRIRTAYDDAGRVASITYAEGKTVSYRYNNRGLLARLQDWLGTVVELSYDASSRLVSVRRSNSTESSYSYGSEGLLADIRHNGPGWEASAEIHRDAAGRITRVEKTIPQPANLPDPPPNPFTPVVEEFSYSPNGRLEGRDYDARGNLVRDGDREFSWDHRGLLRSIRSPAGKWDIDWDAFRSPTRIGSLSLSWNYATPTPSLSSVVQQSGQSDAAVHVIYAGNVPVAQIHSLAGAESIDHLFDVPGAIISTDASGAVTATDEHTPKSEISIVTGNPVSIDGVRLWNPREIAIPDTGISVGSGGKVFDSRTARRLSFASFIQDTKSILGGLSSNLGIRYEIASLYGDTQPIQPLDLLKIAPRVGLVYDFTQLGPTKIYSSYGRFYEQVPLDLDGRDSVLDPYPRIEARGDPRGLESPSGNEFIAGVQAEQGLNLLLGVGYIHRDLGRVIEDLSVDEGTGYFLSNPGTPLSGQSGAATAVTLTPFPLNLNVAAKIRWTPLRYTISGAPPTGCANPAARQTPFFKRFGTKIGF